MNDYVLPDYLLVGKASTGDLLEKQNEIGLLIAGYPRDNEFIIRFEDGTQGVYKADDLLCLKTSQELFDHLEVQGAEMPKADFRAMYNITLFLGHGTLRAQKQAFKLAMSNENIRQHSLLPLSEQLEIAGKRKVGR